MANTRFLTTQVEEHVRSVLGERYGLDFTKERLPLTPGGTHEFDAVSSDRKIVASIKTSSGLTSGGRIPSGKINSATSEVYFLTLVDAPRRLLVLTTPSFHEIFTRVMVGKIAPGIEVVLEVLPPEIQE